MNVSCRNVLLLSLLIVVAWAAPTRSPIRCSAAATTASTELSVARDTLRTYAEREVAIRSNASDRVPRARYRLMGPAGGSVRRDVPGPALPARGRAAGVACSPKPDPVVMRVSEPLCGRGETLDVEATSEASQS